MIVRGLGFGGRAGVWRSEVCSACQIGFFLEDFLNAAKKKLQVPGLWSSEVACESDRICQRIIRDRGGVRCLIKDIAENFGSRCAWANYDTGRRQVQSLSVLARCPCCSGKRPDIDVDVAGSPCQPHSRAGKRRGREDSRTLYLLLWCRYHTVRRTPLMFHETLSPSHFFSGFCETLQFFSRKNQPN